MSNIGAFAQKHHAIPIDFTPFRRCIARLALSIHFYIHYFTSYG
ncbi:hypothetical protein PNIG_a0537 [Pseudoalteromonas nigrifaciens]|uniref:Uncharacterized protein n=1 Tax=Pseudoalteromonas nigrifaciens TaxID=28109 RepID=A0AAC9UDT9_9GAMM|nr:hypothetical protein PNIG_a0537 [Pseudoalteromonas nigrifaciens]GAA73155.1 hypothetical protein P20439_3272 [Pseudoalteromonas sp. BSi20439]